MPTDPPAAAPAVAAAAHADWIAALDKPIEPVRQTLGYRLALFAVAIMMILLPFVYLALIVGVGWLVYLHAVNDTGMLTVDSGSGRGRLLVLILYIAPIVAGPIAIFFMLKPFFAPQRTTHVPLSVEESDQPVLFELVRHLCRAVRAPFPSRIDVDTQVNASASFRRGVRSMLGTDLVLTIGLPLAAGLNLRQLVGVLAHEFGHFAQGGGMRLSYLVRTISMWFARVVYERDAWDERLEKSARSSPHWAISIPVQTSRLCVWLSRRVLWALMYIGEVFSCTLLRQMEFDADRYATRVVGGDTFKSTALTLPKIGAAYQVSFQSITHYYNDGILPDDIAALVTARADRFDAETLEKITGSTLEHETGLFDTHPADRDRIASSEREGSRGVFRFDEPATRLFAGFDTLSRQATSHYYLAVLGDKYKQARLVSAAQHLAADRAEEDAHAALVRYLGGAALISLPPRLDDAPGEPQPASVDDAAAAIRAARTAFDAHLPTLAERIKSEAKTYEGFGTVRGAHLLVDVGFKIKPAQVGLASTKRDALASEMATRTSAWERTLDDLRPWMDDCSLRLRTARRWLAAGGTIETEGDGDPLQAYERLAPVVERLGEQARPWMTLRDTFNDAALLLQNYQGNEQNPALVGRIKTLLGKVTDQLRTLRGRFASLPYPFEHAKQNVSVAEHLLEDDKIDVEDVNQVMSAADQVIGRFLTLYARSLARLCEIAERCERAVGLEPVPEQPSADDEQPEPAA